MCTLTPVAEHFFSKTVWLMMNISFIAVSYFFSDIHCRRVVYADRVVLQVIKAVMLHTVIFMALLMFLGFDKASWRTYVKFYIAFFAGLSTWWLLSRKLLKRYRAFGKTTSASSS